MQKTLDHKLASIHADPAGSKEFILADAKDADMAFGIGAPGKSPETHAGELKFRTLAEYREQIQQIIKQGIVDIVLTSASTNEILCIKERAFENSHVTPAARANDTSDVWVVRGERYTGQTARPFRSASLDHIQCGHADCESDERSLGANLGLYSITLNNRVDDDLRVLQEYQDFRSEAERKGFRHFLEVFDPNRPTGLSQENVPSFINDSIARILAGVTEAQRPVFLKIVYHGPHAMEELVAYDPHLVVGILGGSAGTTYDAFKLISESQKYGGRAALFGRKINNAECQLAFVEFLRLIVEGLITPEEAVRAYHGVLQRLKIRPRRSLQDDLTLQTAVMSYAGGGSTVSLPESIPGEEPSPPNQLGAVSKSDVNGETIEPSQRTSKKTVFSDGHEVDGHQDCGCGGSDPSKCSCHSSAVEEHQPQSDKPDVLPGPDALPDFSTMTQAEKLAYNKAKRDRIFGSFQ